MAGTMVPLSLHQAWDIIADSSTWRDWMPLAKGPRSRLRFVTSASCFEPAVIFEIQRFLPVLWAARGTAGKAPFCEEMESATV